MNSQAYKVWMRAGSDARALGIDASAVIGLRVAKAASGGDVNGEEARLMVAEKIQAAWEMQVCLMTGQFGTNPLAGTRKTISCYGRKVTANRKRLSK